MAREIPSPDDVPVPITTSIPYKVHLDCKENYWSWNELIMSGYRMRKSGEDAQKRINQLEYQIKSLSNALEKKVSKSTYFRGKRAR